MNNVEYRKRLSPSELHGTLATLGGRLEDHEVRINVLFESYIALYQRHADLLMMFDSLVKSINAPRN